MIMFIRLRKQLSRATEAFLDWCHEHVLGRRQRLLKRKVSATPSMVSLTCEPKPVTFKTYHTLESLPLRE